MFPASRSRSKQTMFDPDDLDPVTAAYHEAGHVLVAHQLGGRIVLTTIEDEDGTVHGKTTVVWQLADPRERARRVGLAALGGPLAETRHRGHPDTPAVYSAWAADWHEVRQALAHCAPPGERVAALLARWVAEVSAWLRDPDLWEQLCRIADALEAHGTLDEDLLAEILEASP